MIKLKRMREVGHVALMEEIINANRNLVEKPQGKRPLGRHRHRWEDNIKMDITEIRCKMWVLYYSDSG
jgi:hypothetical protein